MKRLFSLLVISLVALPLGLVAQTPATQTPATQTPATPEAVTQSGAKLAFLNFSMVLESTEEAKVEISKVRTYIDGRNKEYESKAQELKTLQDQFAAQQASLNAATAAEMQREIQTKQRDLQRLGEDVQSEIESRRNDLFGQLTGKMQPIIAEYAQENGLTAVFFVDQLQGWFNPSLDISQEIIRRYNERYPVASSSPQN